MPDCDLLIKNARIYSPFIFETSLDNYFIAINKGEISEIAPMSELSHQIQVEQTIDAASMLVLPGLINCHNHCAMTLFRGLADDLPLMTWLHDYIFPAEAKYVSPDMVYWCTKLAIAEMILSGTTTVADGYFHESAAIDAFIDTGMRAVAAQGVIDFPAPGVPDPDKNIIYTEEFLTDNIKKNNCITPAVFCHSPYTCGGSTIQKAKLLSNKYQVPFFIHVSETKSEVDQCKKQHGTSPVVFLHDLGVLDKNTVLIHSVWLSDAEISLVKQSESKVVTCPESNMKLASGIAPVARYHEEGIYVGLGTDGPASNNNLDLISEMDICAKLHKVHSQNPTQLSAKDVLRMATIDGAHVLGLEAMVGSVAVGKRADLIMINLDKPHLTPFYGVDLLVYAANGSDVDTVIIDGKIIMKERRILSFDADEITREVRKLSSHLI